MVELYCLLFFSSSSCNVVCKIFNVSRKSVRGGQTVSYFLSPKAKIFPCRRLALKYLMEVIQAFIHI